VQKRPFRDVLGPLAGPLCERAGFFNFPTGTSLLATLASLVPAPKVRVTVFLARARRSVIGEQSLTRREARG